MVEHVAGDPILGLSAGLTAILLAVLFLPFVSRTIEENLEPFFLVMGIAAVFMNLYYGLVDLEGLKEVFLEAAEAPVSVSGLPIGITQAVLFFGLLFYFYHARIYKLIEAALGRAGFTIFAFIIVLFLGLVSSIISVIVTAVILSELVAALKIPREAKVKLTVYACFAVGLGAALTPIGEPLSTIATRKLEAPFDFLFRFLGIYVIPGVAAVAAYTAFTLRKHSRAVEGVSMVYEETLRGVLGRAVRVYMFVAALELLGKGFTPMVVWYFSKLPSWGLYWLNTISAVVDNATLTAAEIGPFLTEEQIRSALISLLISGGMLIPGNIPNIVAAGKLRIRSGEWARIGVPFGIALLIIYFIIIEVAGVHVSL